jgi:hypothetical protein
MYYVIYSFKQTETTFLCINVINSNCLFEQRAFKVAFVLHYFLLWFFTSLLYTCEHNVYKIRFPPVRDIILYT